MTSAAAEGTPHRHSRWACNGDVTLHYLDAVDAETDHSRVPLVFVPGFGEEALDHLTLIDALAPRRLIVPDLRGRGPSDKPDDPYDLDAHVADLDAVVAATGLTRVHIASYSRGTAYAMRWAVENPDKLASISVGDYPAAQIAPPLEAIAVLQARERFGRPFTDRIPAPLIAKVIEQAHTELYYDRLAQIDVPLMLMHGTRRSAMATEDVIAAYRAARPDVHLVVIDDGHDLWKRDPHAVPRAIRAFLAGLE